MTDNLLDPVLLNAFADAEKDVDFLARIVLKMYPYYESTTVILDPEDEIKLREIITAAGYDLSIEGYSDLLDQEERENEG